MCTLALRFAFWKWRGGQVVEETVVGIRGLGVELRSRQRGGRVKSDFVDLASIEDVVISEAVTLFDVFPYVAIIVKTNDTETSERTKLPFQELIPDLPALVQTL